MDASKEASDLLLKIGAIHFSIKEPFKLTSGIISPVYIDCRKLISYPNERSVMMDLAVSKIKNELGSDKFDLVAGGETAGIPYAAWVSERLSLPMIYVRKKPKEFGRGRRIEGEIKKDDRVILVEDLIFNSKSKEGFIEGIRDAGGVIEHVIVIFEYGLAAARENLRRIGVELHSLTNWQAAITRGEEMGYFTSSETAEIRRFLADPSQWYQKMQK